jgi:hypothetical protein
MKSVNCHGGFRKYQKFIARVFLIAAFAILIWFRLMEWLFKPEIWGNYTGAPGLALGLACLGMVIEYGRLEYEKSQRKKEPAVPVDHYDDPTPHTMTDDIPNRIQ